MARRVLIIGQATATTSSSPRKTLRVESTRGFAFPRQHLPELCQIHPPKREGAGNAGCTVAPIASRAGEKSTRA
jgi:hypothetical protein